jgi:DUF1365 family protein
MTNGASLSSCFYDGTVMHRRLRPVAHRFAYRVFSLLADLDELPELARRLPLFSHNRWNVMSFLDRDHGPRDGTPLRPWMERQLSAAGVPGPFGAMRILSFPRLFGYVFNPLSVWFCHRRDGGLAAVMYEVSNTFGEHHCYLMPVSGGRSASAALHQECSKLFYVSPFMPMGTRYRFRLREPAERLQFGITEIGCEGAMMSAVQTGWRVKATPMNALRLLAGHPLMTVKVIAAIHWQALRLWLKGAPLFRRPKAPQLVSIHKSSNSIVEGVAAE